MTFRARPASALVAGVCIVGLLASACTIKKKDNTKDLGGGSIKKISALKDATIRVGSKEFDEEILLGDIAIDVLKAAGAKKVVDKTNIQGSTNVRQALTSNQIDLYWDYTGTVWITYLKKSGSVSFASDQEKLFEAVKAADKANHVVWVDPAPGSDTYAIAAKTDEAKKLNISTISEYAALAKKNPSDASLCTDSEFQSRDDGLPGMEKKYGFTLPTGNVKLMQSASVYTSVDKSCNFGVIFSTDGRIKSENLQVLDDDKRFFPKYNIVLGMRENIAQKYPQLEDLFKPVADKLTNETMVDLNKKVSTDGVDAAKVAQDWLKQEGFVS